MLVSKAFVLLTYFACLANGNSHFKLFSSIVKLFGSDIDNREEKNTDQLCIRGGAAATDNKDKKIKGHCIGIDLGTTYSCVAVWKNGRVEICPNEQGNRITPSQVAWTSDGQRLVGDAAKNQAASNPANTVFDVKRLIGRKFGDSSVQKDAKLFPFKCKFILSSSSYHHKYSSTLCIQSRFL